MDFQARTPEEGARHWSSSEGHAPASVLLRMLAEGWQVVEPVEATPHWYGEARYIEIFTFSLRRGDDFMKIPVLGNPVVNRLLAEKQYRIRHKERLQTELESL